MLHFLIIILSYITYFCYYLKKFFNLVSPRRRNGADESTPLQKIRDRKVKNMEKETEEIPLRILDKIYGGKR